MTLRTGGEVSRQSVLTKRSLIDYQSKDSIGKSGIDWVY